MSVVGLPREQPAPALQIREGEVAIIMECPALDQFRIRVSTLVLGNREIDQDPANDSWVAAGGLQRNGCSGAPAQQYEMLDSSRRLQEIHSLLRFPNGALLERKTIMAGRAVPNP